MSLFPMLGGSVPQPSQTLPLYREIMADPDTGLPVWKNGRPVEVEGAAAVQLWAMTALRTMRYHHAIYSGQFGSELSTLMGQGWSSDIKTAEAPRMVREALLVNPYVSEVSDIVVDFADDELQISATLKTIYGEVRV